MDERDNHVKSIIEYLDHCCQKSISEFDNTDLNTGRSRDAVRCWYRQVEEKVRADPPTLPVKAVIIYDKSGQVDHIEYEYRKMFDESLVIRVFMI